MNRQAFSKIWIIIILIIFVAGGFLAWQYFEKQLESVSLSSDRELIQGIKNGKLIEIYSIKQWQEWSEENWNSFALEPVVIAGHEIGPNDFIQFLTVSLSPDKSMVAFALNSMEISLTSVSINGILNLQSNEVTMIPNIIWGDIEDITWSPDEQYFFSLAGTARSGGEYLSVDNTITGKSVFILDDTRIAQILADKDPTHFIPQFREVKWSADGENLEFTTNFLNTKDKIRWIINVDGTGLRYFFKEIADWPIYGGKEYGFEIKYPKDWKTGVSEGEILALNFCSSKYYYEEYENCMEYAREKTNIISLDIFPAKEWEFKLDMEPLTLADIIVDGQKGKVWSWKGWGCMYAEWQGPSDDSRIFHLSTCHLDYFPENQKIFHQMLSTFRFLE